MSSESITVPSPASAPAKVPRVEDRIVVARLLVNTYDSGGGAVHALRGLDLDVRRGEMVAVMGPSGCGKTTLLNCLSGIDEFTSGEVWIAGQRLSTLSDNGKTDFRAMKMGFIFQNYNLLPVLKSVENVELPLLVRGDEPKEARGKAIDALAAVGLDQVALKKPAELSGGQQQRVAWTPRLRSSSSSGRSASRSSPGPAGNASRSESVRGTSSAGRPRSRSSSRAS